jgi:hypothetical protein
MMYERHNPLYEVKNSLVNLTLIMPDDNDAQLRGCCGVCPAIDRKMDAAVPPLEEDSSWRDHE